MTMYKFVGGSRDGLEMEIAPQANYRIKIPHEDEDEFAGKFYATEIYEITDFSRREYHFVGYES